MPRKTPSAWVLALIGSVVVIAPAASLLADGAPAATLTAERGFAVLKQSCFKCHGEGTKLSNLDLRTRESSLKGGMHGAAIVPGNPAKSSLFHHVTGKVKPQMPPTGPLPDADIAALKAWIEAGAPYPAKSAGGGDRRWWAFRPLQRPATPAVKDSWVRNPIDAFVLQKLKAAGLRPSPPADRVTLIRRATFDLHGMPPTPEEIEAFANDRSPNAYEKVIDRLLASPRYGERWGRHWLDLARFAESNGFKADETRPLAWRYRDYVIQSFNEDKPYDRFVREQIAGDELYPNDFQARIATGFNRLWADESNAKNIPLRRQEILNDLTDTTASVFLGLTVGCARCHDHKYDPITHRDYYSLQAFFAASHPNDEIPLVGEERVRQYGEQMAKWEEATREVRSQMAAMAIPVRAKMVKDKRAAFTPDVQEAIDTPAEKRTALQWQLFRKVEPQIVVDDDEVAKAMKGQDKFKWQGMQKDLDRFASLKPEPIPMTVGLTDVAADAAPVHVLSVGVYDAPLEEVQPAFPAAIDPRKPNIVRPAGMVSTGRRSALANWLASAENPLTPRVMVNRVWQYHLGQGIAPTASDFGRSGEVPTHPELLDYLAARFAAPGSSPEGMGWSFKKLHRLIMTSSAYRQSSRYNPASAAVDPSNRLLWRYRRWRLEGEAVRDACLTAAGTLNLKMGGPSIFPELPDGVVTRGGWPETKDEAERNRRSVYIFVRRNLRFPLFEAFDFPDTHEPCARRNVTTSAPQALLLFNSAQALQPAQAMAGRLLREAPTPEARVERAYKLAFGRAPESAERDQALQFLSKQAGIVKGRAQRREPLALPKGAAGAVDPVEGAALVDFCHALMNSNEFLYVD